MKEKKRDRKPRPDDDTIVDEERPLDEDLAPEDDDSDAVASPGNGAEREPSGITLVMTPRKVLAVVGACLVLALLILFVLQWRRASDRADDLASQRDDRQAASLVASDFVRSYLTVDTANPTAGLDHLRSLATSRYAPELEARPTSPVTTSPTSQPTESVLSGADIESVFISEASGDSAYAVCVVTWTLTVAGKTTPLSQLYMELALKREGGTWRVDDLTGKGVRQVDTEATSTTTTPATSSTLPESTVPDTSSGG